MIVVGKALHPSTCGGTAPSSAASVWVATTPTPTCETVRFSSVGEPLETLSRTGFALFFAPNTLAVTPLSVTVLVVPGTTAAFFCFWFTTSNHNHIKSRVRERKHKKRKQRKDSFPIQQLTCGSVTQEGQEQEQNRTTLHVAFSSTRIKRTKSLFLFLSLFLSSCLSLSRSNSFQCCCMNLCYYKMQDAVAKTKGL